MRWNMVFGALVVSVGLCAQSFGFELLDRMLGLNDCGCNSCCQKSCEPSCGCDQGCEPKCRAAAAGGTMVVNPIAVPLRRVNRAAVRLPRANKAAVLLMLVSRAAALRPRATM